MSFLIHGLPHLSAVPVDVAASRRMGSPDTSSGIAGSATPRVGVVVAVKDLAQAKTRMGDMPPAWRGRLAAHMAVAVVRAWSQVVEHVVVVTAAPGLAPLLTAYGVCCATVADPRAGLNAAFHRGEQILHAWGCEMTIASVADLPALTAPDVAAVMEQCVGDGRWFVADAAGSGTTVLIARRTALAPAFGPDSATGHRTSGAVELPAAAGVRHDADDPQDLVRAAGIGVVEPVTQLLDGVELTRHATATVVGPVSRGPVTQGWSLLLTTGSRAYVPADAVSPELRRLAAGQRVQLAHRADGTIQHLWL